jgi:hypothetical protein
MSDDNNILEAGHEFELKTLKNEIERLKSEVIKYMILLKEIDSEANPEIVSDTEAICVLELRKLKETSADRPLSTDEVKKLDMLHKNLKLARGEGTRVGAKNKAGEMSAADLAKIAQGNK